MAILVVAFLVVVAVWLATRRSSAHGDVAASALRSLHETDALAVAAWRKIEAAIHATVDPGKTCVHLLAMRRAELPTEIEELWRYIDDLSERTNRRAEHYEAVARQPAPPLAGRAESERVMARIRDRAECEPHA